MNTKLSLKSGNKLRCHQALSPIKWFDNSPFPLRTEKGGDQGGNIQKNDSVSHMSLFQQRDVFDQKEKMKTKTAPLLLFHPKLVVHPFTVTKTTAALLPSSGSISKLRTINIKIRKREKQLGIQGIRIHTPWRREC